MKGIDKARADLAASKASGEHAEFMEHAGKVLTTALKFKKVMIGLGKTVALAKCPKCEKDALHGRLVTGQAAGRHRSSGGAFRMWCDNCPDVRMME
jgi:hypothetical protein